MSKYNSLKEHLGTLHSNEWRASFKDIEDILGFKLPASAYEYQAWWANQSGSGHTQSAAWQEAGWKTEDLDLAKRTVKFVRYQNAFAKYAPDRLNAFAHSRNLTPEVVNAFAANRTANAFREPESDFERNDDSVRPLTIAQAKAGLAAYFGIATESIEIVIRA